MRRAAPPRSAGGPAGDPAADRSCGGDLRGVCLLGFPHGGGVQLVRRGSCLDAAALALGAVAGRELRLDAQLLADRRGPFQQALDGARRRLLLAAAEIDERAVEA